MPATNKYNGPLSTASGTRAFTITPHATNYLESQTRWLYVGTAGNVTVEMSDGTSITFNSLAAGVFHPLSVTKVTAATAANIVGIY